MDGETENIIAGSLHVYRRSAEDKNKIKTFEQKAKITDKYRHKFVWANTYNYIRLAWTSIHCE